MSVSKSAREVLIENGYPEKIIDGFSAVDARKFAKKADPSWVEPLSEPNLATEIKSYTPAKGKNANKMGMYLSVSADGFNGVFTRLNDGDALTADGKLLAIKFLTSVAQNAADLLEAISQ